MHRDMSSPRHCENSMPGIGSSKICSIASNANFNNNNKKKKKKKIVMILITITTSPDGIPQDSQIKQTSWMS